MVSCTCGGLQSVPSFPTMCSCPGLQRGTVLLLICGEYRLFNRIGHFNKVRQQANTVNTSFSIAIYSASLTDQSSVCRDWDSSFQCRPVILIRRNNEIPSHPYRHPLSSLSALVTHQEFCPLVHRQNRAGGSRR